MVQKKRAARHCSTHAGQLDLSVPAAKDKLSSIFSRCGQQLRQCSGCRYQTSLIAGTLFEHSRLPLTSWFQALYLLTQSMTSLSALELSRHLGVCYSSAWRMKHKLMLECARLAKEIFMQPVFDSIRDGFIFPEGSVKSKDEQINFIRRKAETVYHPVGA